MSELAVFEPIPNEASQLRVPPHSLEAEQSVVGALLLDNTGWERIVGVVREADFYRLEHRLIFRGIEALIEANQPADVITLSEWLDSGELLAEAGGFAYLAELVKNTPSASNLLAYAGIVRERSVFRELIRTGSEIADSGFNPQGSSGSELIDRAERLVYDIADQSHRGTQGFIPIKEVLGGVAERISELHEKNSSITGVATGFNDLDARTSGLQTGDLVIIAGRPSMGKTSLAMNIVEQAALGAGLPVAVFSMEMPSEQLTMRFISSLSRIDQHRVRTGKLNDSDWPRLASTIKILEGATIFLDDTSALTPTEIRARCRRISRAHGLGLVVIDYLQLMHLPGTKENRATEISEISRSLKALAKELSVPVVALSQLNRSLEQRPDKRPVMSDLRESGAIEQDADVILFIYRDEVYNEESPDRGTAEIIIGKQRNGPIGKVRLTFLGHIVKFENHAPEEVNHLI